MGPLLLAVLLAPAAPADDAPVGQAAQLMAELREAAVDPAACYRVRDLSLVKEDLKLFFADGYIAFAKPLRGRRIFAVYQAGELGDGEILVLPPNGGERRSLAALAGAPNLSVHFKNAVLILTDGSARELERDLTANGNRAHPEMGLTLAGEFGSTVRNLGGSFSVRLAHDLLDPDPGARGLFYGALGGTPLGNFDIVHDPLLQEQIVVGQVSSRRGAAAFDIWTSFESRSVRQGKPRPEDPVRLSNYRLQLDLNADLEIQGATRVRLQTSRAVAGSVFFEISRRMDILAAFINGQPAEVFRRESMRDALIRQSGDDQFILLLPERLEPGRAYELEFRQRGRVITPAGNGVLFVGARTNWYPHRGLEYASYDITFRHPKELTLVATGDLVDEHMDGEQKVTRRRTANPVRMAGFNLGEYERAQAVRGGLKVEVYANRYAEPALQPKPQPILIPDIGRRLPQRHTQDAWVMAPVAPPPDSRARMGELAAEIAGAFEFMSGIFGPPPLKTLTVSPIPGSFGQGFPGLLYLSTIAFIRPDQRPAGAGLAGQNVFYSEILHAHETAHQWWGNVVNSATYHDEWIQEALAHYSALLVLERKKGARALDAALTDYLEHLRAKDKDGKVLEEAGPIVWGGRLLASGAAPYRTIMYEKGAWIMHMLRRRMGDAQFMAMLRALRDRYQYKAVNCEQFRELARQFCPRGAPDPQLESFFEQWVYSTGIPTLSLKTSVRGKAPAVRLTLTVEQSGVAEDFSADVPVEIRLPGQKQPLTRWVRTSAEPVTVTVPLRVAPAKVELAPGNGILAVRK